MQIRDQISSSPSKQSWVSNSWEDTFSSEREIHFSKMCQAPGVPIHLAHILFLCPFGIFFCLLLLEKALNWKGSMRNIIIIFMKSMWLPQLQMIQSCKGNEWNSFCSLWACKGGWRGGLENQVKWPNSQIANRKCFSPVDCVGLVAFVDSGSLGQLMRRLGEERHPFLDVFNSWALLFPVSLAYNYPPLHLSSNSKDLLCFFPSLFLRFLLPSSWDTKLDVVSPKSLSYWLRNKKKQISF